MELLINLSLINFGINFTLGTIIYLIYKTGKDIGLVNVPFSLVKIQQRGKKSILRPYLYLIKIKYNGVQMTQVLNENQFESLEAISDKREIEVYMREYKNKYLSPDLCKYDFSLEEVDWKKSNLKKSYIGSIFAFIAVEFILVCAIFQL